MYYKCRYVLTLSGNSILWRPP